MFPHAYPTRYLHIAGAFAAGGTITRINPDIETHLQVPTVAAVDLPSVGGKSETHHSGLRITARDAGVASLRPELMDQELFSVASAHSLVMSDPMTADGPAGSRTISEAHSLRVAGGEVSIDYCRLQMRSIHQRKSPLPQMSLEGTEIIGLRLGKSLLDLELDLKPFSDFATLGDLETALKGDRKDELSKRFVIDPQTGGLYRNASGYVVGSMLKSVKGLPDGASLENGYTIDWKGFGKIIIGEVFMGAYVRRATLVRTVHSDLDFVTGCTGGSWYP